MKYQMVIRDIDEISELFGTPPIEHSVEDGYWCYEVADERGCLLRFSFNLHERSVQTSLLLHGQHLAEVSHEQADLVTIVGDTLRCEFSSESSQTTLQITLRDGISLTWSTLRTA